MQFAGKEIIGSQRRQKSSSQGNNVECTTGCYFKGTGESGATILTSTQSQNHSRQERKEWLL